MCASDRLPVFGGNSYSARQNTGMRVRARLACSGDDITNICRDAAVNGMRRLMAQGRTPADVLKMREMGQVYVCVHLWLELYHLCAHAFQMHDCLL